MISQDQVELCSTAKLSQGDVVLVEGHVMIVNGTGDGRSFFDVTTASSSVFPNVDRMIRVVSARISFDPSSAISLQASAPAGSLLVTADGFAIYLPPFGNASRGVFIFIDGRIEDYKRAKEPAFTRWRIEAPDGDRWTTIINVNSDPS